MTTPDNRRGPTALAFILGATVIAGAIGYLIQALVPVFVPPGTYLSFSVFWSAVYLVVAAIAGLQQEVTRASHPGTDGSGSARRTLSALAVGAAAAFALILLMTAPLWADAAFGDVACSLMPALITAAAAYTLIAVLSGVFYGVRDWPAVAGMTVADVVLRLLCVVLALLFGGGVVALGWAVAVPFLGAFVLLWVVRGRRDARRVELDVSPGRLVRNSITTVGAALATGTMISGLPLLLGLTSRGLGATTLAALILVITLTRAPLVVPLLALQSYLVVTFRDDPTHARKRTLRWGALLLVATAVLAAAAYVVGPWLVGLLYADRYPLDPLIYTGVVASAGLVALLCLTGPAALAAGRHGAYVAGWAVSSIAIVVGLAVVPTSLIGVVTVLVLTPLIGAAVHVAALRGRATSGAPSRTTPESVLPSDPT